MTTSTASTQPSSKHDCLAVFGITAFFAAYAASSWRSWGDPAVDFPHELYFPWRIAEGDALYARIHNVYGPFSQYLNALVFKFFGAGYIVLTGFNLALALAFSIAAYFLISRIFDRLSGVVAALAFISIHAFEQLGLNASYSFIAPYSHEAIHGIYLLLALLFLGTRSRADVLRGVIVGCCLMTKPEFALACASAIVMQCALAPKVAAKRLGWIALGAAIPLAAFTSWFKLTSKMSLFAALKATLMAVNPSYTVHYAHNPIYAAGSGVADFSNNLKKMAIAFIPLAGIALAAGADLERRDGLPDRAGMLLRATACVIITWACLQLFVDPLELARAWPPLTIAGFCYVAWATFRTHSLATEKARLLLPLGAVACVLCLKVLFAALFTWYGFYLLALPTLFLAVLGCHVLHQRIRLSNPRAFVFRLTCIVVFLCIGWRVTTKSFEAYDRHTLALGEGKDQFFVEPYWPNSPFASGVTVKLALADVARLTPKNSTLVAIPEGLIVNYLLRRRNPTPDIANLVTESYLDSFGGVSSAVKDFENALPDYMLYLHRSPEFERGYTLSGKEGFANPVFDWVQKNYRVVSKLAPPSAKYEDFSSIQFVLFEKKR